MISMMNVSDLSLLSKAERVELGCRLLLKKAGYTPARLSKFDDYELFDRNRGFLDSDYMLTFTDSFGKLHALRPDVTLSVMKQARSMKETVIRSMYTEDVFRLSSDTHEYEAHKQIGCEFISKEHRPKSFEIVELALKTLEMCKRPSVLVLSHMGFLTEDQWYNSLEKEVKEKILYLISRKNESDLIRLLEELSCPEEEVKKLSYLINMSGTPREVLEKIAEGPYAPEFSQIIREMAELVRDLHQDENNKIVFDLSLVNPLGYYNGLVFQGFVEGVGGCVLSGGQYDLLARKFLPEYKETCGAIGFALDLDELSEER